MNFFRLSKGLKTLILCARIKYPKTKKLVKKVLSIRPGITGLWQVSGRSDVNFDKRVELDARYVDNMSFLTDMHIMLKTPWTMITGKGAI